MIAIVSAHEEDLCHQQAKGIKGSNNSRNKLHLQYVAFSILHLRAYWELLGTKQLLTSTYVVYVGALMIIHAMLLEHDFYIAR